MPLFSYVGFDSAGSRVSGTIEAAGRNGALGLLRDRGIYPTDVAEENNATSRSRRRLFTRRVSPLDLATTTRQLATLLGAGVPLNETLATVGEQLESQQMQRAIERVRDLVVQGEELHAALATEERIFPELYINMVAVGESGGDLDKVLEQLADYYEEAARIQAKIQAALTYPLLMALIGSAVLFFLITFVLPKVTRMLEEMDRALPWPTAVLIGGSNLLAEWWWLLLIVLGGGLFALQRYLNSPAGRLWFDRRRLQLPLFGKLSLQLATARFARTLGALTRAGVALPKALEISSGLLDNRLLQGTIEETVVAVREGESLAGSIQRSGHFPAMLTRLIAVGEKSGKLDVMLLRAATTYEQQSELTIGSLLALLEPLMILFMGCSVGYIVIAILLPIFEASSGFG
ncbi:MAG: type II secretion system protein GspF [Desulfuromonas sp.]|nr:MAG: type II secretion system protein GspF [Desulfuromonas sp.]